MALDATARRRWVATLALAAALGMLIAGQTLLRGSLRGRGFIVFWLACFGFTFLAMLVAIWDAREIRRRTRRDQRSLLETTVHKIIDDAEAKAKKPDKKRQN